MRSMEARVMWRYVILRWKDESRISVWPLFMFKRSRSFSQDAKTASRASVIFLLVPGVNGGTCAGISGEQKNKEKRKYILITRITSSDSTWYLSDLFGNSKRHTRRYVFFLLININ